MPVPSPTTDVPTALPALATRQCHPPAPIVRWIVDRVAGFASIAVLQTVLLRDWTCCCHRRSRVVLCLRSQMPCSVKCPRSRGRPRCRGHPVAEVSFRQLLPCRVPECRNLPATSRCYRCTRCYLAVDRADRWRIPCQAVASSIQLVELRLRGSTPYKAATIGLTRSSFSRRHLCIWFPPAPVQRLVMC